MDLSMDERTRICTCSNVHMMDEDCVSWLHLRIFGMVLMVLLVLVVLVCS